MIDHIGISVSDLETSLHFYSSALEPLGMSKVGEDNGWVGFGANQQAVFWFGVDATVQRPMHVAFTAASRECVRQFYAAAIAAGATCNGAPGLRNRYHNDYYAAFVIDHDGHNVEAVCHQSTAGQQ
jgi:catechol 2,3-dioxygenase-like lactoylglutathione lyase family enzyme